MLRALHPMPYIGALHWARRLPVSPRVRLAVAARWSLTVLALWLVLRAIDFSAVLALIVRAAPLGLGLAGAVVVLQFVVLVWRWRVVLRILGGRTVGFGILSVLLGYSFLVGQVLPASVGGDVARTVLLARLTGTAAAARSVICDRLLGFAGLALLVVPALAVIVGKMGELTPFLTLTIAALGTVTAAAIVLAFPSLVRGFPWIGRHLAIVVADLRSVLCFGRTSLISLALALVSNLAGVLLIYVLGLAIGAGLRALDCLMLVPPVLLVSALPISLAGWGVREGALVAAFSLVHADPASVVTVSVMSGLTTPLAGAAVTAISLFAGFRGFRRKKFS
jgi:glycosyltransferase 2 family protein